MTASDFGEGVPEVPGDIEVQVSALGACARRLLRLGRELPDVAGHEQLADLETGASGLETLCEALDEDDAGYDLLAMQRDLARALADAELNQLSDVEDPAAQREALRKVCAALREARRRRVATVAEQSPGDEMEVLVYGPLAASWAARLTAFADSPTDGDRDALLLLVSEMLAHARIDGMLQSANGTQGDLSAAATKQLSRRAGPGYGTGGLLARILSAVGRARGSRADFWSAVQGFAQEPMAESFDDQIDKVWVEGENRLVARLRSGDQKAWKKKTVCDKAYKLGLVARERQPRRR